MFKQTRKALSYTIFVYSTVHAFKGIYQFGKDFIEEIREREIV